MEIKRIKVGDDGREIVAPVLHLNGSGRDNLRNQWLAAGEALRAAEEALAQAAPHGRDYYTMGDEAYVLARRDHEARLKAVGAVHDEITALILSLED